MHYIPIWGKFRYAEKMVGPSYPLSFAACRFRCRASFRTTFPLLGSQLREFPGGCLFWRRFLLAQWHGFDGLFADPVAREAAPLALHNLAIGLVHAGVAFMALGALTAAALKWSQLRNIFTIVAASLVFIQLSLAAPFAMHSGLRHMRDESYLQQIKRPGEPARIATPLEKNYLYPEGLNQFDAQIGAQSHLGVPCYNVPAGIDQLDTYTGLRPRRFELLLNGLSERFGVRSVVALRRYAITHMMIKDPYFPDELEVARAASEGGTKVLDNREWGFMGWSVPHRPWATFRREGRCCSGRKGGPGGTDNRDQPGEIQRWSWKMRRNRRGSLREESWQFRHAASNRLRIDAESGGRRRSCGQRRLLAGLACNHRRQGCSDLAGRFPGEGRPLARGTASLEMRYEPEEVFIGWLLSGLGLIALFTVLILEWRKNSRIAIN